MYVTTKIKQNHLCKSVRFQCIYLGYEHWTDFHYNCMCSGFKGWAILNMYIRYVCILLQRGDKIEDCCKESYSQMVHVVDADDEVLDEYAVVVEKVAVKCSTLLGTLYTLFAVHYVSDIEYHSRVKDFYRRRSSYSRC